MVLGVVGKPHGVAGAVYVKAYHPGSHRWTAGTQLLALDPTTSRPTTADVLDAEPDKTLTIVSRHEAAKGRMACRFAGVTGACGRRGLARYLADGADGRP